MLAYLSSAGFSATLRTKVSSSFRAAPPSPPVRYRIIVWIALSMRCSGVWVLAAVEALAVVAFLVGGTFAAAGAGVGDVDTSLTRLAGTLAGSIAAALVAAAPVAGTSYWMIDGL